MISMHGTSGDQAVIGMQAISTWFAWLEEHNVASDEFPVAKAGVHAGVVQPRLLAALLIAAGANDCRVPCLPVGLLQA